MAEDDMLLNFSLPEVLSTKPSFKGGRWKVRLSAKRGAERRERKLTQAGDTTRRRYEETKTPQYSDEHVARAENDLAEVHRQSRPVKRIRTAEANHNPATSNRSVSGARDGNHKALEKPKHFISSLFTYNPESTTKSDLKSAPDAEEYVEPSNAPLQSDLDTFTSLGLSSNLAAHLFNKLELKAPTAIQKAAILQLLSDDSDAFIQAETGSGKTLAYLLPLVQRLMTLSKEMKEQGNDVVHRDSGLFAIILAPTRELSKQISVVLERLLGCANWIVAGTVIGGEKKKSEKARLRKGLNILVATPGRLADHIEHTEALDVSNVRWLVLDEGDRLMELGFENEIQRIVANLNLRMKKTGPKMSGLPQKRITMLCSATMKMDVQRLGEISLKGAVHISGNPDDSSQTAGGTDEKAFSAPAQLKQSFAVVPAKLRLVTLIALLKRTFARRGSVMKAIVFLSCADTVNFHFDIFTRALEDTSTDTKKPNARETEKEKVPGTAKADQETHAKAPILSSKENDVFVFKLHGSLPQANRTSTLASYTKCKEPAVLICTDVASRGLDVPDVDFVIEYDPAFSKEDHLHRIGRTARAGRDGRALIFLQPGPEECYIDILKESRKDAGKGLIRHSAEELLRKGFTTAGVIGVAPSWDDEATEFQLEVERWALASPKILEQARRAYQSHVRAYATHVAAERHIFSIKELHLGHLAKAFALRDKPGSIKVPGFRGGNEGHRSVTSEGRKGNQSNGSASKEHRVANAVKADGELDDVVMTDEQEAKRKMRMKARAMMGGASEFNLG